MPSRDEFNAASAKVAASAPPGLSREDFYKLIDQELAPRTDPLLSHMGERPKGGYTLSDSPDTQSGPDRSVLDALSGAAHPQSVGDFLSLLIPNASEALVPKMVAGLKRLPTGMVKAGSAIETLGTKARNISPIGMVDYALSGDPKGLALAAAPYAIEGSGNVIRRIGQRMGGAIPEAAAALTKEPELSAVLPPMRAPSTPAGPTGSGVRQFMESEQLGNDKLGSVWDHAGYGAEDYPGRGMKQAGQGGESYAGTAAAPRAMPAGPRMPPNLSPSQQALFEQLWQQDAPTTASTLQMSPIEKMLRASLGKSASSGR